MSTFDQDISAWNVDNVGNVHWMFGWASSFNQDLSWCVDNRAGIPRQGVLRRVLLNVGNGVDSKDRKLVTAKSQTRGTATTTTTMTTMTTMGPRNSSCRDSRRLGSFRGVTASGDRECGPGTMRPGPHDRLRSRHDAPVLHLTKRTIGTKTFRPDKTVRDASPRKVCRKFCEAASEKGKLALKHVQGLRRATANGGEPFCRHPTASPSLPNPRRPVWARCNAAWL